MGKGGAVLVGRSVGKADDVCGAGVGGTGKVAMTANVGTDDDVGEAMHPVSQRSIRNKERPPRRAIRCGRKPGEDPNEEGSDINVTEEHEGPRWPRDAQRVSSQ
jgi:hypothetical protein